MSAMSDKDMKEQIKEVEEQIDEGCKEVINIMEGMAEVIKDNKTKRAFLKEFEKRLDKSWKRFRKKQEIKEAVENLEENSGKETTFSDGSKVILIDAQKEMDARKEIKLSEDMKATMEGRKTFNYNKHYDPVSCPECSGAHITTIWERESLNVNGEQKLIVSVPVRKCEGCGFKWIDSVGQDLMDNLIVAYSKDSDYVRWEEVKKELKMKWLKD